MTFKGSTEVDHVLRIKNLHLGPVKMASGDNVLPMEKMATVMTQLLSKEVYIRYTLFYFIFL